MDHFFITLAILIISCIVQFFYFTNNITAVITDEELSPEKFKNFEYYMEKFSN